MNPKKIKHNRIGEARMGEMNMKAQSNESKRRIFFDTTPSLWSFFVASLYLFMRSVTFEFMLSDHSHLNSILHVYLDILRIELFEFSHHLQLYISDYK